MGKPNINCKKCGGTGKHRSCLRYRKFAGVKSWQDCSTSATSGDRHCRCQYVHCSCTQGCFITEATLQSLNKPDDCIELQTIRNYRDYYVEPLFPEQIKEYYDIAPCIVNAINSETNSYQIYKNIWENDLVPFIECINNGDNVEAREIYNQMVNRLKANHLN